MTLKDKKFLNSAIWPSLLGFLTGFVLILVDRVGFILIIFWGLWRLTVLYTLLGIAADFELTKNFKAWLSILTGLFAAYLINDTVVRRLSVPIFMILEGVILLALLILQIFGVKNRWKKLMMQFPVMLFSLATIIMALCQPTDRLFDTVGWCMLILTAVYLVATVLSKQKKQNKAENRTFMDETDDGKVDTAYMDVTGDGKLDISKPYRENQEKK